MQKIFEATGKFSGVAKLAYVEEKGLKQYYLLKGSIVKYPKDTVNHSNGVSKNRLDKFTRLGLIEFVGGQYVVKKDIEFDNPSRPASLVAGNPRGLKFWKGLIEFFESRGEVVEDYIEYTITVTRKDIENSKKIDDINIKCISILSDVCYALELQKFEGKASRQVTIEISNLVGEIIDLISECIKVPPTLIMMLNLTIERLELYSREVEPLDDYQAFISIINSKMSMN